MLKIVFGYEVLTSLAEKRSHTPDDKVLSSEWSALLEFLDLTYIAQKPIVDCCRSEN